jgi:MoxR-like ATPase
MSKFSSTKDYIATPELIESVNASIQLEKPLLIKGEPGTGKTKLAEEIASKLNTNLIKWNIKSTTKANQGLYEYDAVSRLRDSQLGDPKVKKIENYIRKGVLWNAFEAKEKPVLLIDEIDKADIEFPNDLLHELDTMEFFVYETSQNISAKQRPIVIITSNNEKDLPDAFLRRCFFHYINFPGVETLKEIVKVHYPDIKKNILNSSLKSFLNVRETPGMKKKPSTSELLDWIKLILADDLSAEELSGKNSSNILPPLYGALLKNEADVELFQKIAFMSRRES